MNEENNKCEYLNGVTEEYKWEWVSRLTEEDKEGISLPYRSTQYAAGYDFINPEGVIIESKQIAYVKTGVKCKFNNNLALLLLNRSSNPKKKGLVLANGVGLIDADYYNNEDNEGEIAFAFLNITDDVVVIHKGDKLGQAMFVPYATLGDVVDTQRTGGFGSTGK